MDLPVLLVEGEAAGALVPKVQGILLESDLLSCPQKSQYNRLSLVLV